MCMYARWVVQSLKQPFQRQTQNMTQQFLIPVPRWTSWTILVLISVLISVLILILHNE